MDKKTQKRDLRSHFAAILGYEILDVETDLITLRYRTGLWTQPEAGHVTSVVLNPNGDSRIVCGESALLSVSGQKITNENGKADFMLREFYCEFSESGHGPELPIIFVATAQSEQPVFVTTHNLLTSSPAGPDIRIQIYTWEPSGAPAGGVSVNWFCQFPFQYGLH